MNTFKVKEVLPQNESKFVWGYENYSEENIIEIVQNCSKILSECRDKTYIVTNSDGIIIASFLNGVLL